MRDLNITPAHIFPRATHEIPTIIEMTQRLIERGHAYPRPDGRCLLPRPQQVRLRQALRPRRRLPARRRARRAGRTERGPGGLRPLEGREARRAILGQPLGPRPPRLAHRVLRHVLSLPRRNSSTSTAAATTSSSRTTRTRSPRPRPTAAKSRSSATGCTTAGSRWARRR